MRLTKVGRLTRMACLGTKGNGLNLNPAAESKNPNNNEKNNNMKFYQRTDRIMSKKYLKL